MVDVGALEGLPPGPSLFSIPFPGQQLPQPSLGSLFPKPQEVGSSRISPIDPDESWD